MGNARMLRFLPLLFLSVGAVSHALRPSVAPTTRHAARVIAPYMGPFDFLAFGQAAASHILLKDSGRARFIKSQIERGEIKFEEAARQYSTCPSSSKGGDLGAFARGAMVGPFDAWAYDQDTKVGELGIVNTQFGTHIVRLNKKP